MTMTHIPGAASAARTLLFLYPNLAVAESGRLFGQLVVDSAKVCPDCDNDGMVQVDRSDERQVTVIPCPRCMLGCKIDERTRSYQPGDPVNADGSWQLRTFWERQPNVASVTYEGGRSILWQPCARCGVLVHPSGKCHHCTEPVDHVAAQLELPTQVPTTNTNPMEDR